MFAVFSRLFHNNYFCLENSISITDWTQMYLQTMCILVPSWFSYFIFFFSFSNLFKKNRIVETGNQLGYRYILRIIFDVHYMKHERTARKRQRKFHICYKISNKFIKISCAQRHFQIILHMKLVCPTPNRRHTDSVPLRTDFIHFLRTFELNL